jgi:hypothetical protein
MLATSWTTVVISIAGAVTTATTAVVLALIQVRSRRSEELRTRRIEAASEFAKRFLGAADAVSYAIHREGQPVAGGTDGRGNARQLVGELSPFLGPVSLLLGADSQAVQRATHAHRALAKAVGALDQSRWQDAQAALEAAQARMREFEPATLEAAGYSA